ncbi:hypothetical protein H696_06009 [Fonticula alba]|uniref:Replication protein A subunit n=1 Tax=Fonticula alba TaxID=691883 RepID=A0A058Z0S0_FONAL|nr:hypothetical protein H696_06009 [Fonticula alba]KCV67488.1 hypothetical protein H696_06009 [Fonticula alba]|eukprot:XP_009498049.1 hypothetical protein H696_06009 [Fonticula alba]
MALPPISANSIPLLKDKPYLQPTLLVCFARLSNKSANGSSSYQTIVSDSVYKTSGIVSFPDSVDLQPFTLIQVVQFYFIKASSCFRLVISQANVLGVYPEKIDHTTLIMHRFQLDDEPAAPGPAAQAATTPTPHQQYQQQPGYQQQQQQQQQPGGNVSARGRPAGALNAPPQHGAAGGQTYQPIASISRFLNKWTICGRVTVKSPVKHWSRPDGREGQLFSFNLLDSSGEIRCTAFNETAEYLNQVIAVGKVFSVSRCRVVDAKKQFSGLAHNFEISIDNSSDVVEQDSADSSIPQDSMTFVKYSQLPETEKNTNVDVIGVIRRVEAPVEIVSRAKNRTFIKRDVELVNDELISVILTVWGETVEQFSESSIGSIVAVKSARVGDFGGRSLSVGFASSVLFNPNSPAAERLMTWWKTVGEGASFVSISSDGGGSGGGAGSRVPSNLATRPLCALRDEQIGESGPEVVAVKATVTVVKTDGTLLYAACPNTTTCRGNKVISEAPGQFRCPNCNVVHATPAHRFILPLSMADMTGSIWATSFDNTATLLTGTTADHVEELRTAGDMSFVTYFKNFTFREFNFVLRARLDSLNEEMRVRCHINAVEPVNFRNESLKTLELINQYSL